MSYQVPASLLQHTATVERRDELGTNDIGEPEYGRKTIVADVAFGWQPDGSTFIRNATGESVIEPSRGWFRDDVDVAEGDYILVDDGTGESEHQVESVERRTGPGGRHAGTRIEVNT